MKRLVCEMCNSSDLIKQDGLFVCQCCQTKYSVEEARKMMSDETVSVQGTVTIDRSNELENLFIAARNARETSDTNTAIMHYERISAQAPNSWEALFYLAVLKTESIKNSEIASSAVRVINSLGKVFELINTTISDPMEKKKAVDEVINKCYETATWLTSASHNFYKTMTKGNGIMALTGVFGAISSAGSALTELTNDANRCVEIVNIMVFAGNYIETIFDMNDNDYRNFALWCWQKIFDLHNDYQFHHRSQTLLSQETLNTYTEKIHRYTAPQNVAPQYAAPGQPPMNQNYQAPFGVAPYPIQQAPQQPMNANFLVTVAFNSNMGGAGQLWYSIDNGPKNTLIRGNKQVHSIPAGEHLFTIMNPMSKKEERFFVNCDRTITVYGKSFGFEITC